jgi:hypothetical protein
MKAKYIIAIMAFLSFCACEDVLKMEEGSGVLTTDTLYFNDIEEIANNSTAEIFFVQSNSSPGSSIVITVDNNLRDNIAIEKSGKQISIKSKGILKATQFKIYIKSPAIKKISMNGTGNFSSSSIQVPDLEIKNNGTGDINIERASILNKLKLEVNGTGDAAFSSLSEMKELEVEIDGSGDLKYNGGKIQKVRAKINGTGDINLENEIEDANFDINGTGDLSSITNIAKCEISLNGTGSATLRVKDYLKANISGIGDLILYGNPKIELEDQGIGDLVKRN